MSQASVTGVGSGWPASPGIDSRQRWTTVDPRRRLQLVLAGVWLLDGVLQFQSFMFTRGFGQMLGAAARGNPAIIADPITWSARLIDQHAVVMNAIFATIQLLLGLGIAWRPAVRLALGASIGWALAVWWLGEGLGMVFTGSASPADGAPGAIILYALLAVLLWPARQDRPAPFAAGRSVGVAPARLLWLVLWVSLAVLALQPAARAPRGLSGTISGTASGEPGWLAAIDTHLGALLSNRGPAAAVVLAIAGVAIAVGVYLPAPAARAAVVLAIALAVAIWLAQGLGGMLTGSATDPDSAPLLALLALAYWPARRPERSAPALMEG
jgi:hypothetical protein